MILACAIAIEDGVSKYRPFIAFMVCWWGHLWLHQLFIDAPDYFKARKQANTILNFNMYKPEGCLTGWVPNGYQTLTPSIACRNIEFRNVWFKYPGSSKNKWVLKNFNLKIRAGKSIGIIGDSGCGKSTITQLLYRFYDPQQGEITIGGYPINIFTLRSLRSYFGIVLQEPLLFDISIMDNIIYGKPEANAQEILEAAEIANASKFIKDLDNGSVDSDLYSSFEEDFRYSKLSQGYQYICGFNGNKLSYGQRQRIAISRAIIRNPQVLILDEATSSLDENSENDVQQTIDKVMQTRTTIVISDRISSLWNCNRIVEMANGHIVKDSEC